MSNTLTNRFSQRRPRQRGSVLILVIAVLVLTMLVGTAFLQSARRDRFASGQLNQDNLTEVARSALHVALSPIENDVRSDDSTELLIPTGDEYEYYDYPHKDVDKFLASPSPSAGPIWPHLTEIESSVAGHSTGDVSDRNVVAVNTDQFQAGDDADADGDGISDSVWMRAPVGVLQDIEYFYCIRIIDASALLNLNIATAMINCQTDQYSGDIQAPRCWYPTDLDFAHFAKTFPEGTTQAADEVKNLLALRYGEVASSGNLPVPWKSLDGGDNLEAWSRFFYWYEAGLMYNNLNMNENIPDKPKYRHLSWSDEMELRHRGGLNSPDHITALGKALPTLLRENSGATADLDYASFNSDVLSYFNQNPRVMLTTWNGANTYAYRWDDETAKVVPQKDINQMLAGDLDVLATEIATIPPPAFSHITGGAVETANQYVANLKDYVDTDNKLTKIGDRYGMEPLPAISEVYCQRAYKVTSAARDAMKDDGDDTNGVHWKVTWTADGNIGYAIELRNPHPMTIKLTDVYLWINGQDWGMVSLMSTTPEIPPFGSVTLYVDSGGAKSEVAKNQINAVGKDMATKVTGKTWPSVSKPDFNINSIEASDKIQIELRAVRHDPKASQPTDFMTFAYTRVESIMLPDELTDREYKSSDNDALDDEGYLQYGRIGDGRGLNALLVKSDEYEVVSYDLPTDDSGAIYKNHLGVLGQQDKTSKGKQGLLEENWDHNQFVFAPDDQEVNPDLRAIAHIGELLQVSFMGFSETDKETFYEVCKGVGMNRSVGVEQFMFDFDTNSMIESKGDNQKVPGFVALLNRYTTYNTYQDNQDNNGDGEDDNEELFIPGRININTVSGDLASVDTGTHLLMRCLPIPDHNVRRSVIRAILEYRDSGNRPNGSRPGKKGIAYIGELMTIPEVRDALGDNNIDDRKLNDVILDRTPADAEDTIEDDTEEKVMLFKWLSQVLTTRSDVFIVYMTVAGQQENENGKVEVVQFRRYVALVDRSGMSLDEGTGKASILSIQRQQ